MPGRETRFRFDLRRVRSASATVTLFLSSFLVLFLEIALIRWMPAYVRLLAYFSNFILLATFLGIGLGCLLALEAPHRCSPGFRSRSCSSSSP